MNKLIAIWCCFSLLQCTGQVKHKMEYFNIELYKDWEIDNRYSQREDKKFFKKQHERLSIWFVHDNIQVERTSIMHPYRRTPIYFRKNNVLYTNEIEFYQFSIGIQKLYDETGKIIEEIDNDKPYIFSLPQLIEKIKKEHDVDLEDLRQGCSVHRRVDENLKKPIYEVYLLSKEDPYSKKKYFLIDGVTGELIHTTSYPRRSDEIKTPFNQYLISLEKKEQEDNSYYKSYKGKDYTKKEWEAFEEEWYKNTED